MKDWGGRKGKNENNITGKLKEKRWEGIWEEIKAKRNKEQKKRH